VQDVRAVTLRRAADIVGGEEPLARHLGVTPSHLALWIRALADTPDVVFLRAVDIVLAHEVTQHARDAEQVKPV
jgi:DNA-binding transcriptional regulator YdaS (Cro superfamily)